MLDILCRHILYNRRGIEHIGLLFSLFLRFDLSIIEVNGCPCRDHALTASKHLILDFLRCQHDKFDRTIIKLRIYAMHRGFCGCLAELDMNKDTGDINLETSVLACSKRSLKHLAPLTLPFRIVNVAEAFGNYLVLQNLSPCRYKHIQRICFDKTEDLAKHSDNRCYLICSMSNNPSVASFLINNYIGIRRFVARLYLNGLDM